MGEDKKVRDNKFFYYRIYGLNVKSEIEVPELLLMDDITDDVDISISIGDIPKEVKEKIPYNCWYEYKKDSMCFSVPFVAKYYIYGGSNIIVEPCDNANNQLLRTFLLGDILWNDIISKKYCCYSWWNGFN